MSPLRVALVTGAAAGIGRATALRLAKRGYQVVVADLNTERGTSTASEINAQASGGKAAFFKLDVSSEASWKDAVSYTVQKFGGLSTLVNNAGIGGPVVQIENQDLEDWNKLQSINTVGTMLGMKTASAALHEAGVGASVVNVGSVYALFGAVGQVPAYHGSWRLHLCLIPTLLTKGHSAASKGAISALGLGVLRNQGPQFFFAQVSAGEYSAGAIQVNAVLPGWVQTDLVGDEGLAALLPLVPLGRHATSDEIAKAIEFLATEDSSFCTGTELLIDGGVRAK
ncbi:hypothetical protein P7C70_g4792, partial [Phenoliferia sp. Uapishka_3]